MLGLALLAATFMVLPTAGSKMAASVAEADPIVPTPPPLPAPREMPQDAPRINNIGGAKVSSSAPQGEGNGMGQPLAAARELSNFTVPMFAKDGIFLPTTWAGKNIAIHLPGEMALAAAAWSGDGGATYTSNDVDYQVVPYSGGGGDIIIRRKTIFSPSDMAVGVRIPEGTHLRQGTNVVLVETDAHPGRPATVVGTFSIPVARDTQGAAINVTPGIGPGFPNQTNILINLGQANIFAFPIEITLSYRASNTPTSGALTADWDGMPNGISAPQVITMPTDYVTDIDGKYRPAGVDPVLYAQRHSGGCQGGPNEFRSADGRAADFTVSCQRQQMCLDATPSNTSTDVCNNTLFANMSTNCVSTFGQQGDEYDTCQRVASDEVTWVKANMLTGPLCQPVTHNSNTAFLPSNGNRYCR
ncbi:hypothetical protein MM1S1520914_3020 [Mycobacteroides abscessus subsp. bolletii 1S-152-0914]|uniref:IgGFc-binding protein N-terminal domain-containing protein n=1 Tax=Mycobacteroides abscessus MAB_091912_2446 TaxID=1335414 RepID=A0A829MD36_9MYCO|nr:hypothetical protein MM1S1510930_2817 [Mycobacteroides abscessus subsp. bolletii 1S-151-0930]EIU68969.1 hypothetical protein MM1S1520914_3020 [Mycobacteroides abscessus subsp. bolletii 1S-152-0914]EIU83513.1 hypothetical protein MM2B0626_2736 [Mycobacteroides abscessus subsp. bolletii 2B-0626]EIV11067.1 hypothetical protein MM2B0307_2048 [Mycobacteroides abscessus subsp. bolletii 2B-0307]ESV59261.1 hypothetical protein L830_1471 [Mycobacteroides abscessus MAB_082312_2258]ESV64074.1 hypothet